MELSKNEQEAARAFARLGGIKGGKARANALTPEERSEIAREGAAARWGKRTETGAKSPTEILPKETHPGMLQIGDREILCSVLDNGLRVLSISGLSRAMGSRRKGRDIRVEDRQDPSPKLPPFLYAANVKAFISEDLMTPLISPIQYKMKSGGMALGYEATLLPQICEVILDAHKAGVLKMNQQYLVDTAEILMRGFARVGIIALIDEATGYQEVRDRLALQAILDLYLRKEFAKWAKQFPLEFYHGIFRLRGWQWRGMKVNPPQIVAHYTTDLVYARLAPGLVKELEVRNPMTDRGYRKHKHYQYLTEDIGLPALSQHLYAVLGLMRAAKTWKEFMELMNKAHPRRGDTLKLPLFDGDNFESVE